MENKIAFPEHLITPVNSLEGKVLRTGWFVKEKMATRPSSTGGHFSVCYIVEKNGLTGFMKALNLFQYFKDDADDITVGLANMLNAYNYEKELLTRCNQRGLSKVSRLLDSDVEKIPGYIITSVPYLIFERALDDVRNYLNFSRQIDVAFKLRSLHNICVGLKQLHSIQISHQDLKPSNVFIFPNSISKLGDLGRSMSNSIEAVHSKKHFSGDPIYMPPEVMFKYLLPDWHARVYAIDCYLLGSMLVFYFTGLTMNALLIESLDSNVEWNSFIGRFEEGLPYLIHAFEASLVKLSEGLPPNELGMELVSLVRKLCFPDPRKRGYFTSTDSSQQSLIRFISKFDVLATKAEYKLQGYN